jgi:hypothetical protein
MGWKGLDAFDVAGNSQKNKHGMSQTKKSIRAKKQSPRENIVISSY